MTEIRVGDFVKLLSDGTVFVVTRVITEKTIVLGNYDVLDSRVTDEYQIPKNLVARIDSKTVLRNCHGQKIISLSDLFDNFVANGYFHIQSDGMVTFDHSDSSEHGISPSTAPWLRLQNQNKK